jgi:hypothetical protein
MTEKKYALRRTLIKGARSPLKPAWITYDLHLRRWILEGDYTYRGVTVPHLFQFDLSSIPRLAWPVVAPFELSVVAPLIHDWLYCNDGVITGWTFTRLQADAMFYDIMVDEGVSRWRAGAAYRAVRTFGRRW